MYSPFIILCLVALSTASDVLDLKNNDFDDVVKEKDIILVEFYAPWCGHCKKLAPEYEKAATQLLANRPPVPIAKVDCVADDSKDICTRYNVGGFPTLKIFRGGDLANPEDYNGPREANGIVSYMASRAGPASLELKTIEEFQEYTQETKDIMIIGFFADANTDYAKEFTKAANAGRDSFKFAHTYNTEVAKSTGVESDDVVIFRPVHLHSKLEGQTVKLRDPTAKSTQILGWAKDKFMGWAGHLTTKNQQFFKKPLCTVYYNVDYTLDVKGTNYRRNRITKVAKNFPDKLTFAIASKGEFEGLLQDMSIDVHNTEIVAVIYDEKNQKYKMPEGEFSMETLESFANQFLEGQLEPYLKSEEVPADNSGPVKVVVAKNFEEIVNDPERDVLIEFYAPWCGHCKQLEPKYVELGEKLAGQDSVTIAKMDATANDVPAAYNVRGFPTIYWAPKGNKSSPKKYEGGREVKDFLNYIKKEATNKNLKDEL